MGSRTCSRLPSAANYPQDLPQVTKCMCTEALLAPWTFTKGGSLKAKSTVWWLAAIALTKVLCFSAPPPHFSFQNLEQNRVNFNICIHCYRKGSWFKSVRLILLDSRVEFIFLLWNCQSYLAALTGADAVVVARGLVLTHKARLISARRWGRRGSAGEHVVWAGAGGLAADGCGEGKKIHQQVSILSLLFLDWISSNMNLNHGYKLLTKATWLHHRRIT